MTATKLMKLTGHRFGRLTVVREAARDGSGHRQWLCKCDCGNAKVVVHGNLWNGNTQSCGCLHRERFGGWNRSHGLSKHAVYAVWNSMKARCQNPKNKGYYRYGGRGIKVCKRWDTSFAAFLKDMGMPKPGQSIERINNDGNYTPSNCRWATHQEQMRNKHSTKLIEFRGRKKTAREWAERLAITAGALKSRLKAGWSLRDALTSRRQQPKHVPGIRGSVGRTIAGKQPGG